MGKASGAVRRVVSSRGPRGPSRTRARSRRRSSRVRSRGCPGRPTGSRCARSSPPRPPRCGWRPGAAPDDAPAGAPWPPCCRWPGRACTGSTARSSSGCSPARPPATPAATWPRCCCATAAAEPGTPVPATPLATAGTPRLQDVLDLDAPFEVTVHEGFDFWVADAQELDARGQGVARAGQRLGHPDDQAGTRPTRRTGAASASAPTCAGCCRTTRTPRPTPWPGCTPAAPARSATSTRLLGAFRACGLLVPVWELDPDARGRGLRGARSPRWPPGSPTRSRSRRR